VRDAGRLATDPVPVVSVLQRTHPALMASACLAVAGFVACLTIVAPALAPSTGAKPPPSHTEPRGSEPSPSVALEPVGALRVRFALRDARRRSPPSRASRRTRRAPESAAPASNDRTAPTTQAPSPAPRPRPAPRRPATTKPNRQREPQPKAKPAPAARPDFDDAGPPEPGAAGAQPPG
jgi:hypothetical protein